MAGHVACIADEKFIRHASRRTPKGQVTYEALSTLYVTDITCKWIILAKDKVRWRTTWIPYKWEVSEEADWQ